MTTYEYTRGPWHVGETNPDTAEIDVVSEGRPYICIVLPGSVDIHTEANARLIAAAPSQHEEMLRYLPILERAEADPEIWEILTEGTGIATANGYRAAIAKATGSE